MITTAYINLWEERVGAVAWDANTQMASFEYDQKFITNNWEVAPLKMPISQAKQIFSFPDLVRNATFKGLPGLLADVMPDKYGNQLINAWLAQNGRPENSLNPVELLCFIGTRGMGGLEFEPVNFKSNQTAFSIEMDNLVKITQEVVNNRQDFETNLNQEEQKALLDVLKIGTSAGGARPKAIIAFNDKTGVIKSGQAKAPKGFTHWLIKLDGVSDSQFGASTGYGRVEMAYYLMAKACGIEMTECRLLEENGRAHFMTKRFDREEGDIKHHIQTFCAMQHFDFNNVNSYSYEQLFQTMRLLKLPYLQAEQMFRRMVFNVMARNCDDHTKNFAFRLRKNQDWELTPAYDICHAFRPGSEWVSEQALSINGKRSNISKEDIVTIAKSMNIKKGTEIIQQTSEIIKKWTDFAEETKVEPKLKEAIKSTLITF
jgi:serine/threonine-protein kinase HipA